MKNIKVELNNGEHLVTNAEGLLALHTAGVEIISLELLDTDSEQERD